MLFLVYSPKNGVVMKAATELFSKPEMALTNMSTSFNGLRAHDRELSVLVYNQTTTIGEQLKQKRATEQAQYGTNRKRCLSSSSRSKTSHKDCINSFRPVRTLLIEQTAVVQIEFLAFIIWLMPYLAQDTSLA